MSMRRNVARTVIWLIAYVGTAAFAGEGDNRAHFAQQPAGIDSALWALPLPFEENRGQSHPRVRFVARGSAFEAFLTDEGANVAVGRSQERRSIVQMRPVAARRASTPKPLERLAGKVNYLIGDDASHHVTDVPTYARVRYGSIYPGVDLVFYGTRRELEYDFVVAPRADPRGIALELRGAERLERSTSGSLLVHTRSGDIELRKPVGYQDVRGRRENVDIGYVLVGDNRIAFDIGRYDPRFTLVIDPILSISTNLWGTLAGVAIDGSNNIYVVGATSKGDILPVAGGYQTQILGDVDAYVAKLNPTGSAAIFTTYLGARRSTTYGQTMAVDGTGNVYVTGTTTSASFPITPGAFQSTGSNFVTKLKATGNALAYSTYFSASIASIAIDSAGNALMTGTTASLVPTPGAFQSANLAGQSPYVAKLNAMGTGLLYATYLGGSASDEGKGIAVDAAGNAYVVGVVRSANFPTQNPLRPALSGDTDAFVAKLNSTGTALVYSTYLGGSADERGFGITVDAAGQAVAVGWTKSNDFPVTAGVFQPRIGYYDPINKSISNVFVTKLNASGNGLVFSSYLGGRWCLTATVYSCLSFFGPDEGIDVGTSVAIDTLGYVYVGGYATSTEFPLVDSPQIVGAVGDGWHVPLVAKIAPRGDRLVYAAVLGTKAQDAKLNQIAIDSSGGVVAVGNNPYAPYFPLTPGALIGGGASFLFKLVPGAYATTVQSSLNPASSAQSLTLTATTENPTPGSVVTFKDGATSLGTAPLSGGAATLSVMLAPGIHRITAINGADGKVSLPYFQFVNPQ